MTGCSDNENLSLENDFVFTIEYSPAFLETSQVVIESNKSINHLTLQKVFVQKPELKDSIGYEEKNLEDLVQCQLNKNCFDQSVYFKKIEEITLSNSSLKKFRNDLNTIDLTSQGNLIKHGILDGVTVFLRFENEKNDNVFAMRCPKASDSTHYRIITSILNLIDNNIQEEESIHYFENLREYF